MVKVFTVITAAFLVAAFASSAAAQAPERDSLLNGTLIGAAAGVGSAAALDAVFCDNGFGGCDTPWAAYLTLGGIGAGAGAGIDWLIGSKQASNRPALRLSPIVGRTRRGVAATLLLPGAGSLPPLARAREHASEKRDSVWDGALIGAGIGGGGGYIWARNICGAHDTECFAIAGPVGMLSGVGIGAAVGAIADALHH